MIVFFSRSILDSLVGLHADIRVLIYFGPRDGTQGFWHTRRALYTGLHLQLQVPLKMEVVGPCYPISSTDNPGGRALGINNCQYSELQRSYFVFGKLIFVHNLW